jgi:hypothetical protein
MPTNNLTAMMITTGSPSIQFASAAEGPPYNAMLVAIGYGTSPVDFGYFQPSFGFSWPLEAIDLVTGPPETTPAGFIGTVPNEVQF